jgi:hypothetical protein
MSPRRRSEERGVVTPNVALPDSGIHAPGRSVLVEAVLPNFDGRSSLSLRAPFEDFSPRASASPKEGLLSWAFPQRWTSPALWPLYRVSKNSKVGLPLSRTATLHEVLVLGVYNLFGCSTPEDPTGSAPDNVLSPDSRA